MWTTGGSRYSNISQRLRGSRCRKGKLANAGSPGWNNTGLFSLSGGGGGLYRPAKAPACCFSPLNLSEVSVLWLHCVFGLICEHSGSFFISRVCTARIVCAHGYVTLENVHAQGESDICACCWPKPDPEQEELLLV